MTVIIAGSRDMKLPVDVIDSFVNNSGFTITTLLCGMATGIDLSAYDWGKENGVTIKTFFPDWKKYGKSAGVIRNQEMADNADALILIWDGQSRGSANMKAEAKKRNLLISEHVIKKGARR